MIKLKIILLLLIFNSIFIYAKNITPAYSFHSSGFVNDFVLDSEKLYVANDSGIVDIFDFHSAKIIEQIVLPPITSSFDKIIPADILSVDYLNKKVLILSLGKNSYRNVWIYENHRLKQIINEDKKLTIKEVRFINDEKIMISTLGADIILHDISEAYDIYNTQISYSAFSDFSLSEDKKNMVISDESGVIKLVDTKTSNILKTYEAQNLDNVYKVAYANGVILTAGQDRRVGVYHKNIKPYYIKSSFLVFCVGLSPSGKIGIYSSGSNGDMQLFNTLTKTKYERLVGHKGVINKIKFINENELISSERSEDILYWKIK